MGIWNKNYVQSTILKNICHTGTVDHLALFTISYLKLERVVLQEIKKLFVERKSTWTLEGKRSTWMLEGNLAAPGCLRARAATCTLDPSGSQREVTDSYRMLPCVARSPQWDSSRSMVSFATE